MGKAQHTPGPWSIEHEKNGCGLFVMTGTRFSENICEVQNANKEANARLIAVAPELLEALASIANGNTMQGVENFTHGDVIQKHYQIARAAIAKAKGEA